MFILLQGYFQNLKSHKAQDLDLKLMGKLVSVPLSFLIVPDENASSIKGGK
jgi:hypothetical protein